MGSNTASGQVLRKAEVRRPSSHAQRVLGSGLHPALIWGPRSSPPDSAPNHPLLGRLCCLQSPCPCRTPRAVESRAAPACAQRSRHQLLRGTGPNSPEPHLAAPRPKSSKDSSGAANTRSDRSHRRADLEEKQDLEEKKRRDDAKISDLDDWKNDGVIDRNRNT
ncbi:hypothetical protein H8959_022788 [Pygathrix nigripes]